MATWEKAFDTFQWENRSQSTNTPLDATHLNKVNDALDVIDDRVIELQGADADMEEEIAGKQDTLTFDDVPTDGSNNPVKSNGIYDALNGKVDKNGTDRLMTAAEGTKLAGIAAGAQVNVLEGVVVDSVAQPISGKKAFIDLSGKTDLSVIAYTFNSEMGYFKGAYVTYNGKLYEFIQEHTGAWNPSHVREIRASGQYVRAGNVGYNNGDRATCEGYMTKASGNYSHAEGRETQAVGDCTHAEGRETIANGIYQHVEGKYNIADNESKYIHIIGNGIDDNNRSNALTLDWDGNLEVSGDVENGNGEKISDKADKVTNATSGHLAGLDSNGNLTDSGVSPTEDVTVEGNPVTFDSPFEQDAKSVVVSVKPIQDLHGYDHPWVGGAGKNLLPMTVVGIKTYNTDGTWSGNAYTYNDVTFTVQTDADGNVTGIKVNGTASETAVLVLNKTPELSDSRMFLSGCPVGGTSSTYGLRYSNSSDYSYWDTGSGIECSKFNYSTYPASRCDIVVYNGVSMSNAMFYPQIEVGTAKTSFAPYSNICPISGTDEVGIPVSGKNFFPDRVTDYVWGENASGTYEKSGDTIKVTTAANNSFSGAFSELGYVDADLSGVYTYSFDIKSNLQSAQAMVGFTGFGRKTVNITNEWQRVSITTTFNGTHGAFAVYSGDNTAKEIYIKNLQIESGSNSTAYEPYVSHTTTIPLPSTLYDADVDVTEGDADSRYGYIASYNGETLPGAWISDRDVYTGSNSPTIGAEVAYELATHTVISFTPAILELLKGTNVVSTNGEKVAVTYGRSLWQDIADLKTDTEGKLDKSDVATIEGDTASKAYSVNDFMLRADGLYKVTQPIAQNASITASNTTKTTVGEVLTALLNA